MERTSAGRETLDHREGVYVVPHPRGPDGCQPDQPNVRFPPGHLDQSRLDQLLRKALKRLAGKIVGLRKRRLVERSPLKLAYEQRQHQRHGMIRQRPLRELS